MCSLNNNIHGQYVLHWLEINISIYSTRLLTLFKKNKKIVNLTYEQFSMTHCKRPTFPEETSVLHVSLFYYNTNTCSEDYLNIKTTLHYKNHLFYGPLPSEERGIQFYLSWYFCWHIRGLMTLLLSIIVHSQK